MAQNNKLTFQEKKQRAREHREIYFETFKTKLPYSKFLKEENPLTKSLVVYDVSYQVSYRGHYDHIVSTRQTFQVYGFANQDAEIKRRTMDMVISSRGKSNGSYLSGGSQEAIENGFETHIVPRGLEKSDRQLTTEEIRKLTNSKNHMIVKNLDNTFTFKNKKGREGNLKLDITHFM